MSEANKAVFLSYASQDAEAARHICDALRAAEVEVWFDQSALRGGDAWDAKIRKQIKECALFVPIISPNTQARTEGYFRLEWRLADQRTHLMGKSKPFLVPVAIDRASEADADVPDSFMAVQWTKLSDGEIPAGFVGRIRTLLGDARGESEPPRTAERNAAAPFASRRKPQGFWWAPASLALVAGVTVLMWQPWRGVVRSSSADREAPLSSEGGPHAEAQRLVAKVWEQLIKMDLWRPELDRADELCGQATALEPNNADAWAAWSQVDSSRTPNIAVTDRIDWTTSSPCSLKRTCSRTRRARRSVTSVTCRATTSSFRACTVS